MSQLKRVLIISPHFPPVNAADMQRVRQSLPFFSAFGWEAEVMAVDPSFVEAYSTDNLLLETIPAAIKIHWVKAWNATRTRKFGLGSLSMRSFFHFRKKGNAVLKQKRFDLVFFSTTAFHVMALGPYWKKKFGVPFIIDMQDPWRNDFYLNKPKQERPPKFWLAYALDKLLEGYTIPQVDGIISVSKGYVDTLLQRYSGLDKQMLTVIPFSGNELDFALVKKHNLLPSIRFNEQKINVVYVGRGGHDLGFANEILFRAFQKGKKEQPSLFSKVHFWFIGTDYAPKGNGNKTIEPIARQFGVEEHVTEITDRMPYFETLALLKKADVLYVPGSTDTAYTPSKIYPYILAEKPLFGIFYRGSSAVDVMRKTGAGEAVCFDDNVNAGTYADQCFSVLAKKLCSGDVQLNADAFEPYMAKAMVQKQTNFFQTVLDLYHDVSVNKRKHKKIA